MRFLRTCLNPVLIFISFYAALSYGADQPESRMPSDEGIRAKLIPVNSTVLSSELAGNISALNVREGDSFRKGDVLISFDCTMHKARLAKAEAMVKEARKTHESNTRLSSLGSASNLETDISSARLSGSEADASLMQAFVEKCQITAPFDGRVAGIDVKRHQFVQEGQRLMEILDDRQLEVEMIVPSKWLTWLKRSSVFSVHIEETEKTYSGKVDRITPVIDPVSQSVKIFGRITGSFPELMSGMSGTVSFATKK